MDSDRGNCISFSMNQRSDAEGRKGRWVARVLTVMKGLRRLEPGAGKPACPVLRGERSRKAPDLPDPFVGRFGVGSGAY